MKIFHQFLSSRLSLVLSLGFLGVGCSTPSPETEGGTDGSVEAGPDNNLDDSGNPINPKDGGGNVEAGGGNDGGNPPKPKTSCLDLYNANNTLKDGVHTIYLNGTDLSVYCEMMKNSVQNEGGAGEPGWTLILATGKSTDTGNTVKGPKALTELKDKGPTLEIPGYLTGNLMKLLAVSAHQIKIVSLGKPTDYVVSTEITDPIKDKAPLTFLREGKRLDTALTATTNIEDFWKGQGTVSMKVDGPTLNLAKSKDYPHVYAGAGQFTKNPQGLYLCSVFSVWQSANTSNIPLGVYVR